MIGAKRFSRWRVGPMVCLVVLGLAIPAAWAGGTGSCGGGSASNTKTLTCPTGQYVVEMRAKGALYVDSIGIACAPIGANGARGTVGAFMTAGSSGGTTEKSGTCPGNGAVFTMFGASGIYYDRLDIARCAVRNASTHRFQDAGTRITIGVGGPGGITCDLPCPAGEALTSVTVKYGSWIDSISGQCRP